MKSLQEDHESGRSSNPEVNMMTFLLLAIFETFQSNYDSALRHYQNGLKQLLDRKRTTIHSHSQYKSVNIGYESLHNLTDLLERAAPKYFDSETLILAHPGVETSLEPIPESFTCLEEARDVLITEGQWIWDAWLQLELGNLNKFQTQQYHISRLLEWSMAYSEYTKTEKTGLPPAKRQPARLLKAYREALYLVLLTQIAFHDPDGNIIVPKCQPPETCTYHRSCVTYSQRKSALNAHFARLLILSESVLDQQQYDPDEMHSLSVDSGIGPPLYVGATKCRSTKVRHQVTSLLQRSELQKKVWSTLGVNTIAEKLASIEEHGVSAAGAIPQDLDPKWVDITFFLEQGKILLRYCREDQYGGLIWTEEWVST